MRYLKWGVARLILESEPCPTVVPMWIEGPQDIMHEAREAPRWWPRWGKSVSVTFGEAVSQTVWQGFRERWRRLRDKELGSESIQNGDGGSLSEGLMYGDEAVRLRTEVVHAVRSEILKLRSRRGWPDEDPKARLVDTYREEGSGKTEGKMQDGSWVKDT